MAYVSYENINNIPIEEAQNVITWWGNTWVPWVSGEKIDAAIALANMPKMDVDPSIVWRSTDIVRTATNHNTLTWTWWDINFPDWSHVSVSSWSKIMSTITYFYYDSSTGNIENTTVSNNSVWSWKIIVAVWKNVASGTKAIYQVFGTLWNWVLITADNIAANTITANELNINTLSAISANLWTVTAWSISWVTVTGGLFRTKTTWQRVEITSDAWWWVWQNQLNFYNSNNKLVAELKWWYNIWWSDPDDRFFITWANDWLLSISGYDLRVSWSWRLLLYGKNWSIAIAWSGSNTISIDPWSWWYTTIIWQVYTWNIQTGNITSTWSISWSSISVWWWLISGTLNTYTVRPSSGSYYDLWWSSYRRSTIYGESLSVWNITPISNTSYDLWWSSNRRSTLYLWWSSSHAINWSWSAISWTNTSNYYVRVTVWWTSYKLLLSS